MTSRQALDEEFSSWMEDRLNTVQRLIAHDGCSLTGGDRFAELHDIAHNIKGLAASFQYPLMADVAASLCRYLRTCSPTYSPDPEVIRAHVRAMEIIFTRRITGDGGVSGSELKARLAARIAEGEAARA